jgi:predicted metal-dependent peptidase
MKLSKGRDAFAEAVVVAWDRCGYLADALFALVPVPVDNLGTTMSDQYGRCYYDPLQEWDPQEYATLLLHECDHIVLGHFARVEGMDARRANESSDLAINPQTIRDGGRYPSKIKLPNGKVITESGGRKIGPLLPGQFGFAEGLSVEEYYELLSKDDNGKGKGSSSGKPMPGSGHCGSCATGVPEDYELPAPGEKGADGKEAPGLSPAEREGLADKVAKAIEAQEKSKPGSTSGMWQRFAKERLTPKVNWRRQLPAEISKAVEYVRAGQADYSYSHPSRRQSLTNVRLPALVSPVPVIGILLDTSGSMGETLLSQALAEIDAVIRGYGIRQVKAICNDVGVGKVQTVTRAGHINLEGGGGTDLRNGLVTFNEMRQGKPNVVIVLTDGDTITWEMPPPSFRTVICLLRDYRGTLPPWARVIRTS